MTRLDAAAVHAALGADGWRSVLARLGLDERALLNKHGPCPVCGGKDRYRFDNRLGRGDWICNACGSGDGFKLLQKLYGLGFREALRRVADASGVIAMADSPLPTKPAAPSRTDEPAQPTARVREILRGCCQPADVADVREYLASRRLWPLPGGCSLRAHAGVAYWHERQTLGRFPALVAEVRDRDGELVTVHTTYVRDGAKLTGHEPRKLLSALTARTGCAVQLFPLVGDTLSVGEGVETCLAAHRLHDVPIWAALNTALLSKFEPPAGVRRLLVFADRDVPGLLAALQLAERLQGRIAFELRVPPAPHKDWSDVLAEGQR